ncbi:MAG TPA: DUF167 domain-containing protein [Bryobacteraceae bacterium]|jgi:hypothetical protein|nr:DUF167 domain-containing protein [Bryobacteraceae bacterium]
MAKASLEFLHAKLSREGSLVVDLKVIPRSQTSEVSGVMPNGAIRVKVTAAPEKGKANDEVCAVLAAYFKVPKRNVEVTLGHSSRNKRVRIVA